MFSLEIQPARPEDVSILLTLIHELAEYEGLAHEVVATEKDLQKFLFGENKVAEALLGFRDREVVGYALCFQNFPTFMGRPGLYLEDLYVRPRFRGRGYGKAMLRYVARLAKDRGCGRLEWTVLDWNEPAKAFYAQRGGTILPDWRICRVTEEALEKLAQSCLTWQER